MNYPKYNLSTSEDNVTFTFISSGPRGEINKIIKYECIDYRQNIYNLCFGNLVIKDGDVTIDDLDVSDNGDRDIILATVVASIYIYSSNYRDRNIYIQGSSRSRTRLYQMAISKEFQSLSQHFDIRGVTKNENNLTTSPFDRKINYDGFLIIPKR